MPCRLVKGSHYTGVEDDAVNIIKLEDERLSFLYSCIFHVFVVNLLVCACACLYVSFFLIVFYYVLAMVANH
jgi:hypothetical protein